MGGHEARNSDRAVSGHAARRGRRLGERRPASRRWRSPAGRRSSGPTRRYAGTSHIDVAELSASRGARRSSPRWPRRASRSPALGYYPNPLHPDPDAPRDRHRPSEEGHRRGRRDGRAGWSTPSAAAMPRSTVDANWQEALKVWPDIVAHARDNGVKLAFENCPMIFSYDEWPGGHNIAYSPYDLAAHPRGLGRRRRDELRPLAPGLADDRPGAASSASSARICCMSTPRT